MPSRLSGHLQPQIGHVEVCGLRVCLRAVIVEGYLELKRILMLPGRKRVTCIRHCGILKILRREDDFGLIEQLILVSIVRPRSR